MSGRWQNLAYGHVLYQKSLNPPADCAKSGQQQAERSPAMSSSDQDRQRNREIAENEADRQTVGDVRVSVWAIAVAVVAGVIVFASCGCGSTAERSLKRSFGVMRQALAGNRS